LRRALRGRVADATGGRAGSAKLAQILAEVRVGPGFDSSPKFGDALSVSGGAQENVPIGRNGRRSREKCEMRQ
jgi:hypothetical protein